MKSARLVHRAIRSPRPGHIGEEVYSEFWRNLMAMEVPPHWHDGQVPRTKLMNVLSDYPWKPDQRCARVCATFITWLGNNNGQSLIFSARRHAKEGHRHPFLMAWTENNARVVGINNGFRTIEAMLAPDDHFGVVFPERFERLRWIPYLRQEDHEAVEHLCIWLDGPEGQRFIDLAEREIQQRKSVAYDALRIAGKA